MEKMTKQLTVVMGTLLAIVSFNSFAFAQEHVDAPSVIPSDVEVMYQLMTSKDNPFEEWIITGITDSIHMDASMEEGVTSSEKPDTSMKEMAEKILDNNTLTFAMKKGPEVTNEEYGYSYSEPEMFVSFYANDEDFMKLLEMVKEKITITEETYEGSTLYMGDMGDKTYIAHLEDLLILTNKKENLMAVIDNYNGKTDASLSGSESYIKTSSHYLENAFLNVYVNPSLVMNSMDDSYYGYDPLSSALRNMYTKMGLEKKLAAVLGESFSIEQTSDGFNINAVVEGDATKLTELKLNFDKYNFVPDLYKMISGKDIILYEEKSNLKQRIEDTMSMLSTDNEMATHINEWKTDFQEKSGIDIDKDVVPLLGLKSAIAVHKTDQLWPAVTLIFEINSPDYDKTNALLKKFNDYLTKEFQEWEDEDSDIVITSNVKNINNNPVYEHVIDFGSSLNTDDIDLPAETTKMYLHMSLSNGMLVFSMHPKLADIYNNGEGLTDNESFDNSFTNRSESIESLLYMNFDSLHDYVDGFMEKLKAPTEAVDAVNTFLGPWHELYGKSFADIDTSWANIHIKVDSAGFAAYPKLFEDLFFRGIESSTEPPLPIEDEVTAIKFCDVNERDWFYTYVNDLTFGKIIEGYHDGCFHPYAEVTRAEFTKMSVYAASQAGLMDLSSFDNVGDEAYYNDQDGWYSHILSVATDLGYIHGEENFTSRTEPLGKYFHPNDAITRAEAIQILYNMSPRLKSLNKVDASNLMHFSDVHENDWFWNAVVAAYNYDIVDGVSADRFEPHRNLTRAEAAKIIDLFMRLGEMSEDTETHTTMPINPSSNDNNVPSIKASEPKPMPAIPTNAQNVSKASVEGYDVVSYTTESSIESSCEAQKKLIIDWEASSMSPDPIKTTDAWVQIFESEDRQLTLACAKDPTHPNSTVVTMSQSANTVNIY